VSAVGRGFGSHVARPQRPAPVLTRSARGDSRIGVTLRGGPLRGGVLPRLPTAWFSGWWAPPSSSLTRSLSPPLSQARQLSYFGRRQRLFIVQLRWRSPRVDPPARSWAVACGRVATS